MPIYKSKRSKNKTENRLPIDKNKWGANDNSHSLPNDYYYDYSYECCDCKDKQVWTAEEQKHWYEDLGKTINSYAYRCKRCSAHISAIKEDQKRHMEKMANRKPHPNEKFFKKT